MNDNPYFSNISTQYRKLLLLSDSHEQVERGTTDFPCQAYICDFGKFLTGIYPFHWHDELQLTVASGSSFSVHINGEHVLLEPGQGIFINSKVLHSLERGHQDHCERLDIIFHAHLLYGTHQAVYYQRYLAPLLNCRLLPYCRLDGGCTFSRKLLTLFSQAFSACKERPFGFEFLVRECLSSICLEICRRYDDLIHSPSDTQGIRELRTQLMLNYIYKNYARSVDIADIAASASISERECFRCFKQVLNTTPIAFLKRHRIAIALQLLGNIQIPVLEIAYLCGFNDPSYFIKTFRELVGCTPAGYRRQAVKELGGAGHGASRSPTASHPYTL